MTEPYIPLKTARRLARMSQVELARKAQVDQTLISKIELGTVQIRNVGYENVVRIARALGVEPDELFPVSDAEEKSA